MAQYGYGGAPNPYNQREDAPSQRYGAPQQSYSEQSPSYGRNQYNNAPAIGRDDYGGQNVEMAPLATNGAQYGQQADPNAILNECRAIDRALEDIKRRTLPELEALQRQTLNNVDGRENYQLDQKSTETMALYRNLVNRVRTIKSKPEASSPRNAPQIGKIDRAVKQSLNDFQKLDAEYRKDMKAQMARQYRIVRPDATESEVRAAVEDPTAPVFSQALMNSTRQGQANATLDAVKSRHNEIQKIERQMIELAELFQDMENLVVQQEAAVTNIEMKGEEVVENMDKGNEEIVVAIKSARNARKWKWWCLGISILIIVIIVVVILIYKFVIQNNNTTVVNGTNGKRYVLPGVAFTGTTTVDERTVLPVVARVVARRAIGFNA